MAAALARFLSSHSASKVSLKGRDEEAVAAAVGVNDDTLLLLLLLVVELFDFIENFFFGCNGAALLDELDEANEASSEMSTAGFAK